MGGKSTTITNSAPRIAGLQIQTSAYGRCIPIVYGTQRLAGNVFWYNDFVATPHTTTTESGGGGKGGGGVTQQNTTYTYTASLMFGICEGEVSGIGSVWLDKAKLEDLKIIRTSSNEAHTIPATAPYSVTVDNAAYFMLDTKVEYYYQFSGKGYTSGWRTLPTSAYAVNNGVYTFNASYSGKQIRITYTYNIPTEVQSPLDQVGLTFFNGSYSQNAWGFLQSQHSNKALAYRGTAYVAGATFSLGDSAQLPNITFEVQGMKLFNASNANPHDVLLDLLTNDKYGMGFPFSKIGDLSAFNDYCLANDILLSPMFDEQKAGNEHITDFLKSTNSSFVWSDGKLKVIPYGDAEVTGNGVTYTPDLTPIYDLTDDDYLDHDEPIKITRSSNADAYNHIKIEFLNRANQYNAEIAEAKDLANIDLYGLRPSDTIQMHSICDAVTAKHIAQLILQRTLYVRNTYEFKVSWKYCLLEPMDLITITDSTLGLDKLVVRITEIQEDEENTLSIKAEEFPFGIATATRYPSQENQGKVINYYDPAGAVNQPVIFEPPLLLSNAYQVWIGLSGGDNWGGADIWASYDGETYAYLTNVKTPARTGYLMATWSGGTVDVDLTESRGTLLSTSEALAMIDGEIIKYSTAELIGTYQYRLTVIERGLYGTDEVPHDQNSRFIRLDDAIAIQSYTPDMVGRTIAYKALSYNIYGAAKQSLVDVDPFYYKIKGSADLSPLPNITNIVAYYSDNQQNLRWDRVKDNFRSPIDYEVRRGNTWGSAQILGRTATTTFTADINGTYLVKAHFVSTNGIDVYSEDAAEIIITGATIPKNVIATWDEKATGWTGDLSGGAIIYDDNLVLGTDISLDDVLSVDDLANFDMLDSITSYGAYEIPTDHIIELKTQSLCRVTLYYDVHAENVASQFDNIPDMDAWENLDGDNAGFYAVYPKIALSQDGETWGDWNDFVTADYVAKSFKFKLDVYSYNKYTQPIISNFGYSVDVPDRIEKGTDILVGVDGANVAYEVPFQVKPNTQITIQNAHDGDQVVLTNDDSDGFTIYVTNGGVNVSRVINWLSAGY